MTSPSPCRAGARDDVRPSAVPQPRLPRLLQRFFREARAAACFDHPNLCPVHDVGQLDGLPYLTMTYIEGKPLSSLIIDDQPLPQERVAKIVYTLALALEEAHGRGVIHRDL